MKNRLLFEIGLFFNPAGDKVLDYIFAARIIMTHPGQDTHFDCCFLIRFPTSTVKSFSGKKLAFTGVKF